SDPPPLRASPAAPPGHHSSELARSPQLPPLPQAPIRRCIVGIILIKPLRTRRARPVEQVWHDPAIRPAEPDHPIALLRLELSELRERQGRLLDPEHELRRAQQGAVLVGLHPERLRQIDAAVDDLERLALASLPGL